jgi:hypothetical protein
MSKMLFQVPAGKRILRLHDFFRRPRRHHLTARFATFRPKINDVVRQS